MARRVPALENATIEKAELTEDSLTLTLQDGTTLVCVARSEPGIHYDWNNYTEITLRTKNGDKVTLLNK